MTSNRQPSASDSVHGNARHDILKARVAQRPGMDTSAADADAVYPLTLFYESACPLCNGEMSALMLRNTDGKLRFVDVSAPGFDGHPPGVTQQDLLTLIHAQTAGGQVVRGVDVFRLAYEAVGLPAVSRAIGLPGLRQIAEWGYPVLARNRHRFPRGLVTRLFARTVTRAAEQAAAARCDSSLCEPPGRPA